MTVKELIKKLQEFDQKANVCYTWESVVESIEEEDVYLSFDGVVMIGNEYRIEFISGDFSTKRFK